jgi:predicted ATP-grasp superfamily ATP-dependent carboligase
MNECRARNMPAMCLLGETASAEPDPKAAIATLDALNKIFNLGVDTAKLMEKAQEIELQMHQLAEQVKSAAPEELPKEFPMYG